MDAGHTREKDDPIARQVEEFLELWNKLQVQHKPTPFHGIEERSSRNQIAARIHAALSATATAA